MVQEEPVETKDLAMMGLLNAIGQPPATVLHRVRHA
jgi:hypothetical protein